MKYEADDFSAVFFISWIRPPTRGGFFFTSSQVVNTICTEFPNDIHDMHNLWKMDGLFFFHLVFTVCTELPNAA